MKRILIVCLLGMGLLLPYNKITAKEFKEFCLTRIIDIWAEGDALGISSDSGTGTLVKVEIRNIENELEIEEDLSGYSDAVDISGLRSGNYSAKVYTSLTTYTEGFSVN